MANNFVDKTPIMAWGECKAFIADATGAEFPTQLDEMGHVLEKSAVLNNEKQQGREIRKVGGAVVASEPGAISYSQVMSIINPTDELLIYLGVAKDESGELAITGEGIKKKFALQIAPINTGARGIKAGNCSLSAVEKRDEDQGEILDLEFKFDLDANGDQYRKYKHEGTYPQPTV